MTQAANTLSKSNDCRPAKKVAERVLGLIAVYGHAGPGPCAKLNALWIAEQGIARYLSPKEQAFVARGARWRLGGRRDRIEFSWRAEALAAQIWALGGLERMPALNEQFSPFGNQRVDLAVNDPQRFIAESVLRPVAELKEMEDFLYRQHWRLRDRDKTTERLPGDPPLDELEYVIVDQRRVGLGWILEPRTRWDHFDEDYAA